MSHYTTLSKYGNCMHLLKIKNKLKIGCLEYFLTLNCSTDTKTGVHQNARRLLLLNYSSLSYISLALSSAVTKLPRKTSTFHDSQGPTIKFYDFPGLKNEMLKFHDFPGFS